MARVVKVSVPGGERDAVEVSFDIKREDWNEYELADGGRVRVRATVVKILRILDAEGKPALTPEGDPWLVVRHNTHVVASE